MSFTRPSGNSSGGVYTYPYEFTIGTGPTATSALLICDAFDNEVTPGETWTATVNSFLTAIPSGGSAMWNGQTMDYRAAGLIFQGILNGSIDANLGNWAIWGLFSPTARNDPFFLSHNLGLMDLTYRLLASVTPDSAFQGLVLYTPVAGTQSSGGTPQEYIGFIVNVPEPAEIAMLMLMLVGGVMGFAFRQRLGLKLAVSQA